MSFLAIILAAGKGSRMKSGLPKVFHEISGKKMIDHVIEAFAKTGVTGKIVVVGHQGELLKEYLAEQNEIVWQQEQRGTGDAVRKAVEFMQTKDKQNGHVVIACGDTPLVQGETYEKLMDFHIKQGNACSILSACVNDPQGYGRIIRTEDGLVAKIVEEKDATKQEKRVKEINTGIYCFSFSCLKEALKKIDDNNSQGEYYLTDTISYLVQEKEKISALINDDPVEIMGINDRFQLAQAEKWFWRQKNKSLMMAGVTIKDPEHTYIEKDVLIGQDTVVEPGVMIKGSTIIGENCFIGFGSEIIDSKIDDHNFIENSKIVSSIVGTGCRIGPMAYLRPGTELKEKVKIGDFTEIKNSKIAAFSKVPHLSYIGDAVIGSKVNIGCGTITCNYDGKNKHQTIIGDEVFVGSNSNLIAPVEVGERAFIAAGSTITKRIAGDDLALARAKQKNISKGALKYKGKKD